MFGADVFDAAVRQNNFKRVNVIGGCSVNRHARAGGIVRDHSTKRGACARGNVGSETKSVRFKKGVELIEHDSGADTHSAIFDVELGDLPVVSRELDDQSFANRVSDQARAGATRCDRNVRVRGGTNDRACLLRAARKRYAFRLDLINRRVGRVELAGEVVEMDFAAGAADGVFLAGGHRWQDNVSDAIGRERPWQTMCFRWNLR